MQIRPNTTSYEWRPSRSGTSTSELDAVAGAPSAPSAPGVSVELAVADFIHAVEAGRVLNRSGREYQPSAARDMRGALQNHLVPAYGAVPLRDLRREDIQALVDRLAADGRSESRIRSVISALRALYGYAIARGDVDHSPADGLVMPRTTRMATTGIHYVVPEPSAFEEDPHVLVVDAPRVDEDAAERRSRFERRQAQRASRLAHDEAEDDRAPIAALPDRILSLALRLVFALFVVAGVVSLVW